MLTSTNSPSQPAKAYFQQTGLLSKGMERSSCLLKVDMIWALKQNNWAYFWKEVVSIVLTGLLSSNSGPAEWGLVMFSQVNFQLIIIFYELLSKHNELFSFKVLLDKAKNTAA